MSRHRERMGAGHGGEAGTCVVVLGNQEVLVLVHCHWPPCGVVASEWRGNQASASQWMFDEEEAGVGGGNAKRKRSAAGSRRLVPSLCLS